MLQYLKRGYAALTSPPEPKRRFSIIPPPGFKTPPLITAVSRNDIQAVRKLLADGADVEARDDLKSTPLQLAAMSGFTEIAIILLDHGADVNATVPTRSSPLVQAIASGKENTAKALMARGATSSSKELSEFGMARYIRLMSDDQFRRYHEGLL